MAWVPGVSYTFTADISGDSVVGVLNNGVSSIGAYRLLSMGTYWFSCEIIG